MGALGDFVKKGVRLVVTDSEEPAAAPISTPTDIPAEALAVEEAPTAPPSDLPAATDLSAVYAEAGVEVPAHGYGIDKAAEMLANKRLATLAREVRATAVLTALEAAGVALVDVIQDAVRRDRALDAFEAAKRRELEDLKSGNQARVLALQKAIETFLREKNAEIEALKKGSDSASEAFAQLEARKRREEERLRDIVCHFVESAENPITTGSAAAPAPSSVERT
jgi:intracellular sulfur oxidation DsrE/DsrF family protein